MYNIVEALRQMGQDVIVEDIDSLKVPCDEEFSAAVLSPGAGLPDEYPNLKDFINYYHKLVPILGICLGHQALCSYFGARLYQIEQPLHGYSATLDILKGDDPIFYDIAQQKSCNVGLYHSWGVDCSCSEDLELLAQDERKCTMAVKHRTLPIYGFQFHPESVISGEAGMKMIKNWLAIFQYFLLE